MVVVTVLGIANDVGQRESGIPSKKQAYHGFRAAFCRVTKLVIR